MSRVLKFFAALGFAVLPTLVGHLYYFGSILEPNLFFYGATMSLHYIVNAGAYPTLLYFATAYYLLD